MGEDSEKAKKEVEDFLAKYWKGAFDMWLSSILDMEREVRGLKALPYTLLYETGVRSGRRAWLWFTDSFNLERKSTKEKTYYTDAFFSSSGVGEMEFRMEAGEKVLRFKGGTFFARKQGVVGRKACHYLAGFIAGVTSAMMKKEYTVEEVKCASKGDRNCDFAVRPHPSGRGGGHSK